MSGLPASYILPLKLTDRACDAELGAYLEWLDARVELIVVDSSPPESYAAHAASWRLRKHLPPDPAKRRLNGKVWGVLTGLDHASHDRVIVADDDVRYDDAGIEAVLRLLDHAEVVRPQNYFRPLPWHAAWDSGRILLNRVTGGDWPGTLAFRRSFLGRGYEGDSLFENLQMVRSVRAMGGRERVARDVYVRRLPPTTRHFLSQRVRQAYDDWAMPARQRFFLAVIPALAALLSARRRRAVAAAVLAPIVVAEAGRRRAGGAEYFPRSGSLLAPAWVAERSICSWVALARGLSGTGVHYGRGRVVPAANPLPRLRSELTGPDGHETQPLAGVGAG
jgi:hypothetical protein